MLRVLEIVFVFALICLAGCTLADTTACSTDADCAGDRICQEGFCADCTVDIPGCPCEAGVCGTGLSCAASNTCEAVCGDGLVFSALEECDVAQTFDAGMCTAECELFCDEGYGDCDEDLDNGCECQVGQFAWRRVASPTEGSEPGAFFAGSAGFDQDVAMAGRFEGDGTTVEGGSMFCETRTPCALIATYNDEGGVEAVEHVLGTDVTPWWIERRFLAGEFRALSRQSLVAMGAVDGFVLAYEGVVEETRWARTISSEGPDRVLSAAALVDGSIAVGGVVCDDIEVSCASAELAADEDDAIILDNRGLSDGFVAKFGGDGRLAWASAIGGSGPDRVIGVTSVEVPTEDSEPRIAVIGDYESSITLGAGSDQVSLTASRPNAFIALYESSGELAWAASPTPGASARALAVSASGGTFFVLLKYRGSLLLAEQDPAVTLEGDPNEDGLALVAFSAHPPGEVLWARRLASGSLVTGDEAKPLAAIATFDSSSQTGVFIASAIGGTTTFAPGAPNATTLTDVEGADAFVAKFDGADGDLLWVRKSHGAGLASAAAVVPTEAETVFIGGGVRDASETFDVFVSGVGISAGDAYIARFESVTP